MDDSVRTGLGGHLQHSHGHLLHVIFSCSILFNPPCWKGLIPGEDEEKRTKKRDFEEDLEVDNDYREKVDGLFQFLGLSR